MHAHEHALDVVSELLGVVDLERGSASEPGVPVPGSVEMDQEENPDYSGCHIKFINL